MQDFVTTKGIMIISCLSGLLIGYAFVSVLKKMDKNNSTLCFLYGLMIIISICLMVFGIVCYLRANYI